MNRRSRDPGSRLLVHPCGMASSATLVTSILGERECDIIGYNIAFKKDYRHRIATKFDHRSSINETLHRCVSSRRQRLKDWKSKQLDMMLLFLWASHGANLFYKSELVGWKNKNWSCYCSTVWINVFATFANIPDGHQLPHLQYVMLAIYH